MVVLFALIWSAGAATVAMKRFFLDDPFSKDIDARCLDGSPPAYYRRVSSSLENATKFIVYFQGGGWCYTNEECLARSKTPIGSSLSYAPSIAESKGGIVDPDPDVNPNFHSWTQIWVPYCDGTSWSGNRTDPVGVGNQTIYYRGRANMRALVAALRRDQGLDQATDIIMDGGSAGGLTVFLHADFFGSLLPSAASFAAIGDAGWFRPSVALDKEGYTKLVHAMVSNSEAISDEDCIREEGLSNCFFAPVVFPHLSTKMFVLEGMYDSWQLRHILGFPCATYGDKLSRCTLAQNASLESYGVHMRASIRLALTSTPHHQRSAGAFVSQCIIHVQSVFNENHDVWHGALTINGDTPHDVVSRWYFNTDGKRTIEDCGTFGCNKFCQTFTAKVRKTT